MDANGVWYGLMGSGAAESSSLARRGPRILVIGAGSRGNAYSRSTTEATSATVYAVADPIAFKRQQLGRRYIWRDQAPRPGQEFNDWQDFLKYETVRRERKAAGEKNVEEGVDAVFVCTLDEQHADIVVALAPLGLHVLCEKPLATTLKDCLRMYSALTHSSMTSMKVSSGDASQPRQQDTIFSIGHVLRYSPHNMLLRLLLLHDKRIGMPLSIDHTEPVGYWHFSHSYVRGNWRSSSRTAPSLLTKSCHDIDLLLWLLSSPADTESSEPPHLPSTVSSTGRLNNFRRIRKPKAAGSATNCLSCPIEASCLYSAKRIYIERFLRRKQAGWPVKIIVPEIEDIYANQGEGAAEKRILTALAEDYDASTPTEVVQSRNWFGRCVWESDNDVCDDQVVTITWDDDEDSLDEHADRSPRLAKQATFHMIAQTEAQCERRGVIYGTTGEITYDSKTITVTDFETGQVEVFHPKQMAGGHGGGDDGLARSFIKAVQAVIDGEMDAETAQKKYVGCTLEDVVRSHALVFAAEEARTKGVIVNWNEWWKKEVETQVDHAGEKVANIRPKGVDDTDREWEVVSPQSG